MRAVIEAQALRGVVKTYPRKIVVEARSLARFASPKLLMAPRGMVASEDFSGKWVGLWNHL